MKRNPILWILALCLLALAVLFLPDWGGEEPAPPPAEDPAPTKPEEPEEPEKPEPAPEPIPEPAPEPEPQPNPETQPDPEQEPVPEPEEADTLTTLLEEAGRAAGDIPGSQLIIVRSSGNEASLWAYGRGEDGVWTPFLEEVGGHVGKNGVTGEKAEGDRCTPAGLYGLPMAFGVEADPGALLPYRQVTAESYWVDDPDSQLYNQWAEGTENQDWSSAEHLADYPAQYAYAALIDYNTDPVVPGAGSAIFLHCGGNYTAGCVSIPQEKMVELLLWLDPAASPAILIY